MLNFSYANPTRLVFGRSAEHEVGRVMTSILGRPGKVLVLFGGGSAHRTGILGAVEDSLQESGFAVIEMGGVQPNPRMGFVRDTIDWVRDQGHSCGGRRGRRFGDRYRQGCGGWSGI